MKECNFTYNNGEHYDRGKSVNASVLKPSHKPVSTSMRDIPGGSVPDEKALYDKVKKPESARRPDNGVPPLSLPKPLSVLIKSQQPTEPEESVIYTQGFLKSQLSKRVNIFSLVGQDLKEHRGTLKKVGANFLVLDSDGAQQVLCDLSSIKFIKIN